MALMAAAAARDALNAVSTDDESVRQGKEGDDNDKDNDGPDSTVATSAAPTRKIWSVRSIRSPAGFRNSSNTTQRLFSTSSTRPQSRVVIENNTQVVLTPDQQHLLLWNGFVDGNFQQGKVHDLIINRSCWNFAYSPNQMVLVVGAGNLLQFYDTTSYLLFGQVEREGFVSSIVWWMGESEKTSNVSTSSPSLGYLAVGGLDGVVTLYCMDMDLLEMQAPIEVHEYRSQGQVRAMSLSCISTSHDDKILLWAVGDQEGQLTFSTYDVQQVELLQAPTRVEQYESAILGLSISPAVGTEPWCAIATKGGCLTVHAIQRQQQQGPGNEASNSKRFLFASPSSWSLNSAVHWGVGPALYQLEQRGPIRSVAFSMDGRLLACGGYDKTVVIVDTILWAAVYELRLEGTVGDT
jgi:WD40 repeat protein